MIKRFVIMSLLAVVVVYARAEQMHSIGPRICEFTSMASVAHHVFACAPRLGVFHSTDDGRSWQLLTTLTASLAPDGVSSIRVCNGKLYASSTKGTIVESSDAGDTWHAFVVPGVGGTPLAELAVAGDRMIYAPYEGGVWLKDAGKDWTEATTGIDNRVYISKLLYASGRVYAATVNGSVYVSSDKGTSWSVLSNDLLSARSIRNITTVGKSLLAVGSDSLYISTNNGANWRAFLAGTADVVSPMDTVCLVIQGSRIRTIGPSGSVWVTKDVVDSTTSTLSACVKADSLYMSTTAGLFTTGRSLASFKLKAFDSGFSPVTAVAIRDNYIYTFVHRSGVYATSNSGITWMRTTKGLLRESVVSSTPSVMTVFDNNVYLGIRGCVYSMAAHGEWSLDTTLPGDCVTFMNKGDTLWLGLRNGQLYIRPAREKWRLVQQDTLASALTTLVHIGDTLYRDGSFRLFASTNNAKTWQTVKVDGVDRDVRTIATLGDELFVGLNYGVFSTRDAGSTWIRRVTGLPRTPEIQKIVANNDWIYVLSQDTIVMQHSPTETSTWKGIEAKGMQSIEYMLPIDDILYVGTTSDGLFVGIPTITSISDATPHRVESKIGTLVTTSLRVPIVTSAESVLVTSVVGTSQYLPAHSDDSRTIIDTSALQPGLWFVTIVDRSGVECRVKLIKH